MILTTDSESGPENLYVFFNILQRFHRKFLSGNQRKILVTSGINEFKTQMSNFI